MYHQNGLYESVLKSLPSLLVDHKSLRKEYGRRSASIVSVVNALLARVPII